MILDQLMSGNTQPLWFVVYDPEKSKSAELPNLESLLLQARPYLTQTPLLNFIEIWSNIYARLHLFLEHDHSTSR